MADEAAVGLAELGVGEGDVVGLLLPAAPEHFVTYVAAAKLGAVTAAVNPKLVQAERAAVLRAANPRVVVTTEDLAQAETDGQAATVLVEPATRADAVLEGLRRRGARPAPLAADEDRPIAIVFTSGTTGTPKGAVFCGRQIGFITAVRRGRGLGRRRPCHGGLGPGAPRPHDEAGGQPEEGRHPAPVAAAVEGVRRAAHGGRAQDRGARRRADPDRADAARSRLRHHRPLLRARRRHGRRSGHAGPHPRGAGAHRRAAGRPLLVHRGGHRVRHRLHGPRRGRRDERGPAPARRAADHPGRGRRGRWSPAPSARCASALRR